MKRIAILAIVVAVLMLMDSCKKKETFDKCFSISNSTKAISTDSLVNKIVEVEWHITDGPGNTYSSTIAYTELIKEGVPSLVIFGLTSSGKVDKEQPIIRIILNKKSANEKALVYALKVRIEGSSVWNGMSYAEIGVEETPSEIIISSNGLSSPDGKKFMCVKVRIKK